MKAQLWLRRGQELVYKFKRMPLTVLIHFTKVAVVAASLVLFLILPLFLQSSIAEDIRPASDDYCILWKTENSSISEVQNALLSNSSGRYSYLYSMNILYRFGPMIVSFVPLAIWLMLVASLTFLIRVLRNNGDRKTDYKIPILAAGLISSCTLMIVPNQYQNFFWGTGVLNYTFGIALLALAFGVYAKKMINKMNTGPGSIFALFIVMFIASMFNEPQTLFGIIISGFLLLLSYRLGWGKERKALSATAFIAMLAGMAMILSSNGAQGRIASSGNNQFSLSNMFDSLMPSASHTWEVFTNINLEWVGSMLVFALLLGFLFRPRLFQLSTKRALYIIWLLGIGVLFGIVFLNVLINEANFVPVRTLLLGFLLLSCALLFTSASLGSWLRGYFNKYRGIRPSITLVAYVVGTIILAGVIYGSLTAQLTRATTLASRIQARATLYDQREHIIRSQAQSSSPIYLSSLGIRAGVPDLKVVTPHWINDCFAEYYDLSEVKTYEEFKL